MSTKEEKRNHDGFGFCQSFMGKCCVPESAEEKAGKFDFKNCEQMMKQFRDVKDGKFDFEKFRAKIQECCKAAKDQSSGKETN